VSMATFARTTLSRFIQENHDSRSLWLLLHIPKTAGSSLSAELAKVMKPYRNIHINYENSEVPARLQKQEVVDQFIADAEHIPFRSASGHITMRHALQIRSALPHVKIITFLRDPVERVISDFRYQTTPAHPPHKQFIMQFPSIHDYIKLPRARNKMFRFLTSDPKASFKESLRTIERELTFVGTLEAYAMSFNVLFRLFGVDVTPEEHRRRTESNEHNRVSQGDELPREIRQLNELDVALYEHFRALLEPKEREWRQMGNLGMPAG
jgi:hypothetical protein